MNHFTKTFIESIPKEIGSKGCWIHRGVGTGRYPLIKIEGKRYLLHRVVAHVYHGLDIHNSNQLACHKEDCNTKCFNPEHIYVGTSKSNRMDWNYISKTCRKGHEFTKENTYIDKDGERHCKRCNTINKNKWYHRNDNDV